LATLKYLSRMIEGARKKAIFDTQIHAAHNFEIGSILERPRYSARC
jgi:hypothetical protein